MNLGHKAVADEPERPKETKYDIEEDVLEVNVSEIDIPDISTEMFEVYCKHYGLTTSEEIARCWNGGPQGMQNEITAKYWKKVKNQLDG